MPDRSIRNININHRHPHAVAEPPAPRPRRRRRTGRLWILAAIVIVIAAVLGALLSLVFAGASLTVTPRTATVTLPPTIQAAFNAPVGTLNFQEASVTLSATTTVPANGTEQVQKPATGQITIQNTYSTTPQRLITGTRFQAPDGKIYKIHDPVVVPGMQGSQAGTVTATAYAESPGPDYNRSGTTVYTLPGFKGKSQYAKITAVSGPMTGGFIGSEPTVAQSDLARAKQSMEQQLDSTVRQQLAANMPADYQVIQGTLSVSYDNLSQTAADNNQAAVTETATGRVYVVRSADLAAAVAKQTVQGYTGEAVAFANPSAVAPSAATSTAQASTLILQLSGQATLVWQFDPNALKTALVGQPKSQFEAIIKQFEPAIAKADASLRPFWTSTFPTDPDKISITVEDVH